MPQFIVLVMPDSLASSVSVTLDVLRMANLAARELGRATSTWEVIGQAHRTQLTGYLSVSSASLKRARSMPEATLLVHGIGLDEHSVQPELSLRYDDEAVQRALARAGVQSACTYISRHHTAGGTVAASCSAVLALAQAGVLEGLTATTHWRLTEALKRLEPQCTVDTKRMVVRDGSVITAGAAMAQMELMLTVVRAAIGPEVADLVMRYMLIDERASQGRYMLWDTLRSADPLVARFEAVIEQSFPDVLAVSVVAKALNVTERTLARRIRKASGMAPSEAIQRARMRRVQVLLETSTQSFVAVANAVGYSDINALRKLTTRLAGASPSTLRAAAAKR